MKLNEFLDTYPARQDRGARAVCRATNSTTAVPVLIHYVVVVSYLS